MDAADSVTLDVQILTADTTAAAQVRTYTNKWMMYRKCVEIGNSDECSHLIAQALAVLGQSDFETSLATTMTSDAVKMQV